MSSSISAGTTAGTALAFSGDTSGALVLQTNGTTTAVTISTAQVVTLAQPLPVASGGSGVTTSTGTGANVLGTLPSFTTTIGVGAATASASGSGISFPATQSASTDVNTLDDYEEGTWTPVATAPVGTITSYNSAGTYVKIGRNVSLQFSVQITNAGTGSGALNVAGIPFAATANLCAGGAKEIAVSGTGGTLYYGSSLSIQTSSGGNPVITNYYWVCGFTYLTTS